jgi:photosystem II stability/assembly factor-like uncharacterized protein
MKRTTLILTACAIAILGLYSDTSLERDFQGKMETEEKPNDWFLMQRSFPYAEINYEARDMAFKQAQHARESVPQAMRGLGWSFGGPLNIGGRISALAMHPDDITTIYAGAASGGIFKSVNSGQTWTSVFEDAASLSIGDIAIADTDPGMVWVGTGEANAGGGSMTYDGDGIYMSEDGGVNWQHTGLVNIGSVGRLAIHPDDPNTVFVAAMGRLFSNNPDRGVFRTTDGGSSWEKVLYLNDSTGAIDIVIHPLHPDTIYAAMWERVRTPDRRTYGGPGSGIFRSYDGGENWTRLTGGLPASSAYVGRIGLDISLSDPDVLYAIYADNIGYFDGVYRTANGGESWIRTNDGALANFYASYGWWFGRIVVDPSNANIAYAIGFDLYKTTNGGNSWSYISSPVHVDQHDLIAHPANPNFLVLGNDGGVYLSSNAGSAWTFLDNLPITQFYTCETDEQYPERLYGGTQDNGTNRTFAAGLGDWESIYWGDGFYVLVDQTNNNYVYAEYQYGQFARSTNGGASFSSAMSGISGSDRMNWCTPFVIDPGNPQVLYYGANRLYKSTNRAASWQAISSDLTNGAGNFNQVYGTITTIAVAPSNSQYIYVGTDDGNAWRTVNGGTTWVDIGFGLPERWITRVAVDPDDESTVYITLSGYKYDSYQPHIFQSINAGTSWLDISGDLPEAPVNDVIVDPELDSTLYAATDFGVFVTHDLGIHWQMLGDNLPNVPVTDLRFHAPTRTLVAATYGRSMYTFDVDQLVSYPELKAERENIRIFPNPASDILNIEIIVPDEEIHYSICSISGQVVKSGSLKTAAGVQTIGLAELSSGNYLLEVYSGLAILEREKILIVR